MNGCDGKFLVLKSADIQKHLSEKEQEQLLHMTQKIGAGRVQEGKNAYNEYWVCNKDESYAPIVQSVITVSEATRAEYVKEMDYLFGQSVKQ